MSSSKQSVFVLTTVIFFSALLFVFPQNILFEHSSEILTVSTFLFAIFVGFYIAASLTNYTNLQKLVAVETSNLMALYDACRLLEPRLAKNVAETIDTYLINSFDFELIDSVEKSWGEFDEICKVTTKIKKKESNVFAVILEIIKSLQGMRQEFELSARRIMNVFDWLIVITLACINITMLFLIRDPSLLSSISTVAFSTIFFTVLFLLNLLDSNKLSEEKLAFTPYEVVFRHIGKLPYYPETALNGARVRTPKGSFRIGQYVDYPRSLEKKIKLVRAER